MAQHARREDLFFSENAAYKKQMLELQRVVKGLERARDKEILKAEQANKEAARLRAALAHKEKELRSALVRADSFIQSGSPVPTNGSLHHSPSSSRKRQQCSGCTAIRNKLKATRERVTKLESTIACQEEDLHKAANEIQVLACALEQRAEDLGVDGNLETGLLYQLGLFQKESQRATAEVNRLRRELQGREREASQMKEKLDNVSSALESAKSHIQNLLEERGVILDYLKETNSQSGQLQDHTAVLLAEKDESIAQYKKALQSEKEARERLEEELQVEQRRRRSQTRNNSSELNSPISRVGSPNNSRRVADPVFEKLLKETEAQIEANASSTVKAQLLETISALEEKVSKLEIALADEKLASSRLEDRMQELRHAKETAEARLIQHIDDLEQTISELQNEQHEQTVRSPTSVSGTQTHAHPESSDLKFKHDRLQGLLKLATEARELAENEASKLEMENAKLRQRLRVLGQS